MGIYLAGNYGSFFTAALTPLVEGELEFDSGIYELMIPNENLSVNSGRWPLRKPKSRLDGARMVRFS
jgi:hypothetical protein